MRQIKKISFLQILFILMVASLYCLIPKDFVYAENTGQNNIESFLQNDISMIDDSKAESKEWKFLNQKAVDLYHHGKYDEALKWAEKVYEYANQHFGEKHSNTLTSMNNLAELYRFQGRYDEAEPLYEKALQLREDVLGEKHPDTLNSLLNYSILLIN